LDKVEEMKIFLGHSGAVFALVRLRKDHLASASYDSLIKIRNYASGRLVDTFKGHDGSVKSLILLMKTSHLASAADDGSIRIWNVHSRYTLPASKL
jgi:WD40 repeat protein